VVHGAVQGQGQESQGGHVTLIETSFNSLHVLEQITSSPVCLETRKPGLGTVAATSVCCGERGIE
jgi:hypothetical protein